MSKRLRKYLALLCVVTMLAGSMPIAVFADEEAQVTAAEDASAKAEAEAKAKAEAEAKAKAEAEAKAKAEAEAKAKAEAEAKAKAEAEAKAKAEAEAKAQAEAEAKAKAEAEAKAKAEAEAKAQAEAEAKAQAEAEAKAQAEAEAKAQAEAEAKAKAKAEAKAQAEAEAKAQAEAEAKAQAEAEAKAQAEAEAKAKAEAEAKAKAEAEAKAQAEAEAKAQAEAEAKAQAEAEAKAQAEAEAKAQAEAEAKAQAEAEAKAQAEAEAKAQAEAEAKAQAEAEAKAQAEAEAKAQAEAEAKAQAEAEAKAQAEAEAKAQAEQEKAEEEEVVQKVTEQPVSDASAEAETLKTEEAEAPDVQENNEDAEPEKPALMTVDAVMNVGGTVNGDIKREGVYTIRLTVKKSEHLIVYTTGMDLLLDIMDEASEKNIERFRSSNAVMKAGWSAKKGTYVLTFGALQKNESGSFTVKVLDDQSYAKLMASEQAEKAQATDTEKTEKQTEVQPESDEIPQQQTPEAAVAENKDENPGEQLPDDVKPEEEVLDENTGHNEGKERDIESIGNEETGDDVNEQEEAEKVNEGEEAKGEEAKGEEAEGEEAEGEEAEGEEAEGEEAKGEEAKGEEAKGEEAEGEKAKGEEAEGEETEGEEAKGEEAEGEEAKGEEAEGEEAKGEEAEGEEAKGEEVEGEETEGEEAEGEETEGEEAEGEEAEGEEAEGEETKGEEAEGEETEGEEAEGEETEGEEAEGEETEGEETEGEEAEGEETEGEETEGEETEGEETEGEETVGEETEGEETEGEEAEGEETEGEETEGEETEGEETEGEETEGEEAEGEETEGEETEGEEAEGEEAEGEEAEGEEAEGEENADDEEVIDGEELLVEDEPTEEVGDLVPAATAKVTVAANKLSAYTSESVTFTATTTDMSGEVTYKWERSKDNENWENTALDSGAASMTFGVTQFRVSYYYRCVVTDDTGSYASNGVKVGFGLPASANMETAGPGEVVTFTVDDSKLTGDITYKWERSTDNENFFNTSLNSGSKSMSFTATEARLAFYYRCVVTDSTGTYNSIGVKVNYDETPKPVITAAANVTSAAIGEKVTFTATAANTIGDLTFTWQRSSDNKNWTATSLDSGAATMTFDVTESRLGYYYRCLVTDSNGSYASEGVKVQFVNVKITATTSKAAAGVGENVRFSVTAKGTSGELTYKWERSADNKNWISTSLNSSREVMAFDVTEARLNFYYRCVVTDRNGSYPSNGVKIAFNPTTSPVTVSIAVDRQVAAANQPITFTATVKDAQGELSYRWERSTDNSYWIATSLDSGKAKLTFNATEARLGWYYRCIVTDSNGSYSSKGKKVDFQPDPVYVTVTTDKAVYHDGEIALFTASVEGAVGNVSYRWERSVDNVNWFSTSLNSNAEVMSFGATQARLDYYYHCVITDDNGSYPSNGVKPGFVNVYVTASADKDSYATGEQITYTAVPEGMTGDLTFIWERSSDNEHWFGTSLNSNAATMTFEATAARLAFYYRCAVTDSTGTYYSNGVGIIPFVAVLVSAQADKQAYGPGETVTFTGSAEGTTGEVTYSWESSADGTDWAVASQNSGSDVMTFEADATALSLFYRFVVTDANGSFYSDSFKAEYIPISVSAAMDKATYCLGETIVFTATVTGDAGNGTFCWERSADGDHWFSTSLNSGQATMEFEANESRLGFYYRCVVTDGTGTYSSNAVKAAFDPDRIVADKVIYEKIDDAALRVLSYTGTASSLTIPMTVQGLTVIEVGASAFENNVTLISINLPSTIQFIRARAFKNCTSLRSMGEYN